MYTFFSPDMGFETTLLGTLGLLAMFSASAVGQFQMNPPSFGPFPPPMNLPSPQNFPSSSQPGSFNPFNPISNFPQNFPSIGPQSFNQPGETGPNFPDIFSPPGSNPGGFNLNNFQQNLPQNLPSNQPGSFGPSSNIPQNVPSLASPGGFHPYNSQQNVPHSGELPDGGRSYRTQPGPPQPYPSSNNPAGFNPNNSPLNAGQLPAGSQPSFNSFNPQSQQNPSPGNQRGKPSNSNSPQYQIPSSSNPNSKQKSAPGSHGGGSTSPDSNKSADSSRSGNASPNQHVSSKLHPSIHSQPRAGHRGHSLGFHPVKDDNPLKEYRIVCLFNNRHYFRGGFTPSEIDPSLCTHVNYEFAILDPKSYEMMVGEPDLDITQNFYQEAVDLRKVNPKLKVLLSLGGWSDSTKKYSEMAADEEKRKNFVEKAVTFLKSHEFDGMDLAWEYPNCWQGAIGISPKDKDNFVLLLKEIKSAFEKEGLILSVSVGAIKREVEAAYDIPGISSTVDYINVMTYDMHGPWEKVTGHHVQFEKMPDDTDPYCNVRAAMEFWAEKGADKKKLNMGLALYAKTFTLADENNHGMGAPAVGVGDPGPDSDQGGFLLYNEVCPLLNGGNWTEAEDKHAGFYAYSGDQWACYDNPLMMVRKAKFVVEEGYGGVLLKDLSGDDYKGTCFSMPFPLLKMCRLEMIQRIRRKMRHQG